MIDLVGCFRPRKNLLIIVRWTPAFFAPSAPSSCVGDCLPKQLTDVFCFQNV